MSNPTHYEIQKSSDNTNWITVDYVEYGTNEYYFDNKGMGGITQYFRVKAVILSQPRTVYPKQTDLPLESAATTSDSISCVQSDNIPQYWEIEESTDGGNTYSSIDTTSNYSYYKENRTAGQEYYFRVRGNNTPVLAQTNSPGTYTGSYCDAENITCGILDLTQTEFILAEIFDIFLNNGEVWRFTSYDTNITYDGDVYTAIPCKRGDIKYHTNLQVDKVTIDIGIVEITIGTVTYTINQLIERELLRNARVLVRFVGHEYFDVVETVFEGWITEGLDYDEGVLYLEVGSILDRLNENFPKILYNPFCPHKLYDTKCRLVRANYESSGAVISDTSSTSTRIKIYSDVFSFSTSVSEGYYAPGKITFTSGDNNGISRSIFRHYDGYAELIFPLNYDVQDGDTFDVWPGCDKRGQTCDEKFGNYDNFLGFEYIPDPKILYTSLV